MPSKLQHKTSPSLKRYNRYLLNMLDIYHLVWIRNLHIQNSILNPIWWFLNLDIFRYLIRNIKIEQITWEMGMDPNKNSNSVLLHIFGRSPWQVQTQSVLESVAVAVGHWATTGLIDEEEQSLL